MCHQASAPTLQRIKLMPSDSCHGCVLQLARVATLQEWLARTREGSGAQCGSGLAYVLVLFLAITLEHPSGILGAARHRLDAAQKCIFLVNDANALHRVWCACHLLVLRGKLRKCRVSEQPHELSLCRISVVVVLLVQVRHHSHGGRGAGVHDDVGIPTELNPCSHKLRERCPLDNLLGIRWLATLTDCILSVHLDCCTNTGGVVGTSK